MSGDCSTFGGGVHGIAGGEQLARIAELCLCGGAIRFRRRELSVQFGQLLLGHGRTVREEQARLRAEGFHRRFRLLHLAAQLLDLLGEPLRRFAVDPCPQFDLLGDVEFRKPVRNDRRHARIGGCKDDRDDARSGLLINLKTRKHHVGDVLDVGRGVVMTYTQRDGDAAEQTRRAERRIEFRVTRQPEIGDEARDEWTGRQQLNFRLDGLRIRQQRRVFIVEGRNLARARREHHPCLNRIGRRGGGEPEDRDGHEACKSTENDFLARPYAAQHFPWRNIADRALVRRGAAAVAKGDYGVRMDIGHAFRSTTVRRGSGPLALPRRDATSRINRQ